jgi:hypothetical protein
MSKHEATVVGEKVCPRCNRSLHVLAFAADHDRRNGLCVYCRECVSAMNRERYRSVRKLIHSIFALALLASGCASMSPAERGCIVASAADLASTVAGLNAGATESNPMLTVGGEDAAMVVLTSAALTTAWIAITRKIRRKHPGQARAMFNLCTGLRSAVALHNLDVARGAE